ncbi:hypothetical protein IEQ34_011211 [Dendrobium chrysotoxum]|uniref:Uncharacterized protein n=1 Tax=Dendrobium chrysotoxum TaxID=161865 RepID=A0AAV7GY12_DENCH|nr:hypothetical protein IEQ34_011211 [Dendrobium chrysotoxum]
MDNLESDQAKTGIVKVNEPCVVLPEDSGFDEEVDDDDNIKSFAFFLVTFSSMKSETRPAKMAARTFTLASSKLAAPVRCRIPHWLTRPCENPALSGRTQSFYQFTRFPQSLHNNNISYVVLYSTGQLTAAEKSHKIMF